MEGFQNSVRPGFFNFESEKNPKLFPKDRMQSFLHSCEHHNAGVAMTKRTR